MEKGTKVKMSKELKQKFIENDCKEHVDEFGECVGIVEDKMFPEDSECDVVNVRWQPSGLRYGYSPEELVIVE